MDSKNLFEKLRAMNPKDYIYPAIFIAFVFIVLVLFFSTAASLSQSINKIFSLSQEPSVQGLNTERYALISRKLNIKPATSNESITPPETTPLASTTPNIDIIPQNKKEISLAVINTTTKNGLAGALAKKLEEAGYNKPTTATEKKLRATTTLMIKTSKETYVEEILRVVQSSYPNTIVATTTDSASTDAVVIIGAH